jgi:hypothetical protein
MDTPRILLAAWAALGWLALCVAPIDGQQPSEGVGGPPPTSVSPRPTVFFDCGGPSCNEGYYRTQIGWVNWVRDRADSDVHLIMSSQPTGSGGREYLLDYVGVGQYELYQSRLTYQAPPTETNRETLDAITQVLSIGFAHFAAATGSPGLVLIEGREQYSILPASRVVSREEVDDRWNFWVFRINANGNLDGEATRTTKRLNGSFSASRVTPTWKLNFRGNVNYNQRDIQLTDAPDFRDTRTDWGLTQFTAYALADHWSVGWQGDARRSARSNQRLRLELTPAVEYSFFPYEEATRRALTVFYTIGPSWRDYFEPTVFLKTDEVTWEQSLEIELSQRQPWGDASIRLLGSHLLHDVDLYRLEMRGDIDVRVVRGISLNAEGSVGWVNDQIYLPAEGATDAEALLNLQQQAQDFTYSMQIGVSIQFGSIFNNVVNNRFGGGGFSGFFR